MPLSADQHSPSDGRERVGAPSWARLQDRLGTLLGCAPSARRELLSGMMSRSPSETTAFWLQMTVAVGIATFGLVLDSTAVVIGAMLIAPLMTPIVGLAMGLAVGSPFLVLRSVGRVLLSVVVAIGGAAIITTLVPFHETTSEIAARGTPTALDLFTAAFCALAGAYSSMRPGSGTAATAAGTSIGISLVPPLCASGYGVGTAQWAIAGGAALLFTANFVAIVVVSTTTFVAAGFNRLNVAELEARELEQAGGAPLARAAAKGLARLFASPGGPVMRLVLPFVLLAAVYVPLRHALDEVAWQIRVRSAVNAKLSSLRGQVVQSHLRVEGGVVELSLLIVGTTEQAERARGNLTLELTRVAGVTPQVEVMAVPDARAMSGLTERLRAPLVPPRPVAPPPKPVAELLDAHVSLRAPLDALWPAAEAGALVAVWTSALPGQPIGITVLHVGGALGESTRALLSRALRAPLGGEVRVIDLAIPREVLLENVSGQAAEDLTQALERMQLAPSIVACVEEPEPPAAPPTRVAEYAAIAARLRSTFGQVASTQWLRGPIWRVRFAIQECAATGGTPSGPNAAD